ncbi:MAG: PAS domain-containing sensor histidine kinase [Gemmatimonadales bacterium]|nr:MAG: PAS domain-containing sensor histidine kinase [Gemmatimonadales bacterium]
MMRFPSSIRGRLLLLGLVPLVGGGALVAVQVGVESRERLAQTREDVQARALAVGSLAGEVLQGTEEVARLLSGHRYLLDRNAEGCARLLRDMVAVLAHVAELEVQSRDGSFGCSTWDGPGAARVPFVREEARQSGAGLPVQIPTPEGDAKWVVPVEHVGEEGVGRAYLRTLHLTGLLASVATGEGEVLSLADTTGVAIARSPEQELWVGRDLLATGVPVPPEGAAGVFEGLGADGRERIWGFVRIEGSPWLLLAGSPSDAVAAAGRAAAVRGALLAVLLFGLFGAVLLGGSRFLQRAMTRLEAGASEARRRRGVRVPEEGPEEVAALGRALNRTLEARDQAEQELAEALERHELVLQASRDMFWDWNPVDEVLVTNEALRHFLGGQLAGARSPFQWFVRIPEPDRTRVRKSLDEALERGGSIWVEEYPMADAEGGKVRILDRGYVVRNEEGEPVRMVGVMSDVTEARRRSDEVRRTKDRYESIVRNAPFAVFLCTESGEVIERNPALDKMLGPPVDEVAIPLRAPDFFVNPTQFQKLCREARERGVIIGREARWKKSDGTEIFVRLTLSTFDEGGDLRLEVLAEDVTDRRRMGEQVRHSQKMEAVGRLAGGVAHDFNNLLTVISGESRVLLNLATFDEDTTESLEAILEAGERGTMLTQQLLAFSRRQVANLDPVDLNLVVTRVDRMLSRLIGENITLVLELAEGLPAVVGDQGELEQVVMNLALNARDAMPRGGRIHIRTGRRTITDRELELHPGLEAGTYGTLSVGDEGAGIDPAIVSRIFEPFFTTKAVGKGTGLGLSIVYGIVSRLGGVTEVETAPGEGTTLHLFLPAAAGGVAVRPRPQESPSRGRGGVGRIVVVEDEAGVRRMALRILERAGYEVESFEHPSDALERFSDPAFRADLLLTDVRMPGMNGNELVDRVRKLRASLPVIYMSGYPEEAAIADRILAADADFIPKPFNPDVLLDAIRHMLNATAGTGGGTT